MSKRRLPTTMTVYEDPSSEPGPFCRFSCELARWIGVT